MHNISQSSHGTGYNGYFLNGFGILLEGTYKCMPYFMIGDNFPLFRTEDPVLLLLTYQNHFHSFQQILLGNCFSAVLDSQNGRLIDHIGQVRTYGS